MRGGWGMRAEPSCMGLLLTLKGTEESRVPAVQHVQTGGGWPPASLEEGSHQNPALLAPWPRTPASRTVSDKCLLLRNHTVYGGLSQQPELTMTEMTLAKMNAGPQNKPDTWFFHGNSIMMNEIKWNKIKVQEHGIFSFPKEPTRIRITRVSNLVVCMCIYLCHRQSPLTTPGK